MSHRSDDMTQPFLVRVANYGIYWVIVVALAAPIVSWRLGEPTFGCLISPLVVIVGVLPFTPIVMIRGWKKIFLNWHVIFAVLITLFWMKYGEAVAKGPIRLSAVTSATTFVDTSGVSHTVQDYKPYIEYAEEIKQILLSHLEQVRISSGDITNASREIVARGYGSPERKKLNMWFEAAKRNGFGHWGGRSPEQFCGSYEKYFRQIRNSD